MLGTGLGLSFKWVFGSSSVGATLDEPWLDKGLMEDEELVGAPAALKRLTGLNVEVLVEELASWLIKTEGEREGPLSRSCPVWRLGCCPA